MNIEQTVSQKLNQYPEIKRGIKAVYQHSMYMLSPKIKSEGDITRISPDDDNYEYFFGYYDKSPEDVTGQYVLCLRAENTWSNVAPAIPAQILLIDTAKEENAPGRVRVLATTHAWNVQQGCMMQWLGPDFDHDIIYNDFRDGEYVSVILNVFNGEERVLKAPVYSVSKDGCFALTLDFSRLHRLRPGYGYSNKIDETANQKIPDSPAIWRLDLRTNVLSPVLKYIDFTSFQPRPEMKYAEHKVNHIMLNPSGDRFMVLHRWFDGQRKYTRLVTVNTDGTGMYNLSDDDMVSHCYWKDDRTIIAFENKKGQGAGYYLMTDMSQHFKHLWPHLCNDGHPSYSPDGRLVVTDTYPNRRRISEINILNETFNTVIARVFSPFKYNNDTRCDLHPRWSRDGKKIYFDSVFEGHRGLYLIDLSRIRFAYPEMTGNAIVSPDVLTAAQGEELKKGKAGKIHIVYLMTSCKNLGPTQQTLNIIKNLNPSLFETTLITINNEEKDSRLAEYLPWVSEHYFIKTGKKDIILGKLDTLKNKMEEIKPDIVHSVGVFPDYAVSQIGRYRQVHTLRNYIYDDYLLKYGKLKGMILARLQLSAIHKSDKTIVCSESLSKVYKDKLGMDFDFIRNGVDFNQFSAASELEKKRIRENLKLPDDAFIFVYAGQFIERKNIPFLLENYVKAFENDEHAYLLLLGDGPGLEQLKEKYKNYKQIDFRGKVSNVNEYLKACDVYVSASNSEGLPNGVLEAMASGLAVVLSDIEQHKEIFKVDPEIGYLYHKADSADLMDKLKLISKGNAAETGKMASKAAYTHFSAEKMSQQYQDIYRTLVGGMRCGSDDWQIHK